MGYFLELTTSLNRTKEVVDLMLGKWLIEMPELRALSGDSDANKAFLTKRSDKERLSYQQFGKDFPRRCVFIGTTNNDDYLKDSTGNRRYWPIKTGACKKDELKKEIPQIWAEAVNRYKAGESWWFKDTKEDKRISDIAEQVQGIKRERDDLEEEVSKYIAPKEDVKSIEIWRNVYNGSNNNFTKDKQMELGRILRVLNWETFSTGGERKWRKRTT